MRQHLPITIAALLLIAGAPAPAHAGSHATTTTEIDGVSFQVRAWPIRIGGGFGVHVEVAPTPLRGHPRGIDDHPIVFSGSYRTADGRRGGFGESSATGCCGTGWMVTLQPGEKQVFSRDFGEAQDPMAPGDTLRLSVWISAMESSSGRPLVRPPRLAYILLEVLKRRDPDPVVRALLRLALERRSVRMTSAESCSCEQGKARRESPAGGT